MFSKGNKKGTVQFCFRPNRDVRKVAVAGDFNGWMLTAMKRNRDGSYSCVVSAAKGNSEYKFIVDDEWITDPDNNNWSMNPFGTFNSVMQVD